MRKELAKKSYWDKSIYSSLLSGLDYGLDEVEKSILKKSVLVNCNNLSGYVDVAYINKTLDTQPIKPPFDDMWLEMEGCIYSDLSMLDAIKVRKHGAHVTTHIADYVYESMGKAIDPSAKDAIIVEEFLDVEEKGIGAIPIAYFFILDSRGVCIDIGTISTKNSNLDESFEQKVLYSSLKFMYMLSFFHAKGVPTKSVRCRLQPNKKKVNGKKQFIEIVEKVILVAPSKASASSKLTPKEATRHIRQHLCRGHFSRYTEENKLFGKHTGTFWIPSHVRGAKENGETKVSYAMA